ncbi:MAG: hypothetical protein LBU32_10020 [Clostridiales bacterium]|jgi:hypothetical protein|nr:hypothetical protein [Clostridiales bacterium]
MNAKWKDYMAKAVSAGARLADCYGLVKGYLFQQEDGTLKYNSAMDMNSAMAYAKAKSKGAIAAIPEMPGLILYTAFHQMFLFWSLIIH